MTFGLLPTKCILLSTMLVGFMQGPVLLSQNGLGSPLTSTLFASYGGDPVAVDLDADGDSDFVVILGGAIRVVWNFSGSFVIGPTLPTVANPIELQAADLDGDGDTDFVALSFTMYSVLRVQGATIVRNDLSIPPGVAVTTARLIDSDGDGDRDLLFCPGTIVKNDGAGAFTSIENLGLPIAHSLAVVGITYATTAAIFGPPLSYSVDQVLFADVVGGAASGRDMVFFTDGGPGLANVTHWPNILAQVVPTRTITVVAPTRQSVRIGRQGSPIVFEVRDAFGVPEPFVGVTMNSTEAGLLMTPVTLITDALGRVSLTPIVAPTAIAGPSRIVARAPLSNSAAAIVNILGLRGGRSTAPNGSEIVDFEIIEQSVGVPFIFAADFPPAAPFGTPFGDIWTSILAPTPSLYLLDGIGTFASPVPGLTTAPNIAITATLNALPQPGSAFVAQAYGIDDSQPYPANLIVTNPYFLGF